LEWEKSSFAATIANSKVTLSLLEVIEECGELSLIESRFKSLLIDHISYLLNKQRIYWKQRGNIKWVKLGDQDSKIFHANASIRKRRNIVSWL
jgi:hypothetical protein